MYLLDTPRTDELINEQLGRMVAFDPAFRYVQTVIDFARTLERELAAQSARLEAVERELIGAADIASGLRYDLAKAEAAISDWSLDGKLVVPSLRKARIAELEAALAEAQGDSERYRWLRNKAEHYEPPETWQQTVWPVIGINHTDCHPARPDELDAAIDAAIAQGGGDA